MDTETRIDRPQKSETADNRDDDDDAIAQTSIDTWASIGFLKYKSQQWDEFSPLVHYLVQQFTEHGYSRKDYLVMEIGSVAFNHARNCYTWSPLLPQEMWSHYLCGIHDKVPAKTSDWETSIEYRVTPNNTQSTVSNGSECISNSDSIYVTTRPPYKEFHIYQRTSSYPTCHFMFSPVANCFSRLHTQKKQHFVQYDQVPEEYTYVKVHRERKYIATFPEHDHLTVTFTFTQTFEAEDIGSIIANPHMPSTYHCKISIHCGDHPLPLLIITMLEQMVLLQHSTLPQGSEAPFVVSASDANTIDPLGRRVQYWLEKFS